ncbi:MAG: carboxymuconolactone decarboxylase family protein [Lachnospiraceae bacterium]|nr:carboxymuconolactone decarboxylase family protein [Lachnospiraceae bacterium]
MSGKNEPPERNTDMARNHWTILGEMDPELNDLITAWRTTLVNDEKLERKYRELINVAMAALLKQGDVALAHAKLAHQYGATKEEILGSVEQMLTMGGFPSFRCAMLALDEFFQTI